MADLAFGVLSSHYKEKLEGFDFISMNQLQVRALGLEYKFKNVKDTYKPHRSNMQVVNYGSDTSDICILVQYTNIVQKDRPFKKKNQGHSRITMHHLLLGESRAGVMLLFCSLLRRVYATMPWAPPASDSSNPTWEHEGI